MNNRLKELRTERGYSQNDIANLSGISQVILNKIENGEEVNLNTREVVKLAEVLGTKPSKIFII